MKPAWYVRRLTRMSAREVSARVRVVVRQRYWASPRRRPGGLSRLQPGERRAAVALSRRDAPGADLPGAGALIAAADALLAGTWPVFHLHDAAVGETPDWFRDPLTGRTAPDASYAFAVPYRDEAAVGNIKFVWELSRHQATTVLAAAWWVSGDRRYAERAASHLRSWWAANPFLHGVHWTSAIETGLRLISWSFIRAFLDDWPGVTALFDGNDAFAAQLYHHQLYTVRFHSRGSSANNHLIAELAGLAASTAAFPWFAASARWGRWARTNLAEQAGRQTHADGLNREQASEYHLFVSEMLIAASLAAKLAGRPAPDRLDAELARMADALAASLDCAGHPPRYGDGDNGRGVLADAPGRSQVDAILDAVRATSGAASWWPAPGGSVLGHIAGLLARLPRPERTVERPVRFDGAGMTLLRHGHGAEEIWVRCDAGPHGFLSIAAHGHADALSIEVRHAGVEVFADPGTYCYHGQAEWRAYFKGTRAHNTLRLDDADQAVSAGPFLWLSRPHATLTHADAAANAAVQVWQASHDGYRRLRDPATHHRHVELRGPDGTLTVTDWIDGAAGHDAALSFHLGPCVAARLDGAAAHLSWPGGAARLDLPPSLSWTAHCGETAPPLGWYSREFGHRQPSTTLVGRGRIGPGTPLETRLNMVPDA